MKIIFPKSTQKFVKLQCNDDITSYTNCPEISSIRKYVKTLQPKNVLELGSGIGRISVYLKVLCKWNNANFYLLDGNSGDEQIADVNDCMGSYYYNSLDATRDFCIANGINKNKLTLFNAEKIVWDELDVMFDLCYSFKAIGFHWPITEYLNILYSHLVLNAILIFEIRDVITRKDVRYKQFNENQLASIPQDKYKVLACNDQFEKAMLILKRI